MIINNSFNYFNASYICGSCILMVNINPAIIGPQYVLKTSPSNFPRTSLKILFGHIGMYKNDVQDTY